MGRRRPHKRGGRSLLAGAALLLALLVYSVGSAYETAVRVGEFVWHAHEFFQRSVSLAAIVSSAVFGLIIYGIYALHSKHISESCRALVGENLMSFLKEVRSPVAIVPALAISSFLVLIDVLPPKRSPIPLRATSATIESKTEIPKVGADPQVVASSSETPRLSAGINGEIVAPKAIFHVDGKSRIEPYDNVERDVCDLSLAFSSQELAACEQYLRKHPRAKGTGGRIYVVRRLNNILLIEPLVILRPPMPRPRPPVDIEMIEQSN